MDIQRGECVDEKVGFTVVEVALNYDILQFRLLFLFRDHLVLEFDRCRAEIVRNDRDFIIVGRFVSESLRYDMLSREVKRAHWPALVALKSTHRVDIAHLHSIAHVTLEHLEQLQKLLTDFLDISAFVLFILLTKFLKTLVLANFDPLRFVNSLLLAYRPVKVD